MSARLWWAYAVKLVVALALLVMLACDKPSGQQTSTTSALASSTGAPRSSASPPNAQLRIVSVGPAVTETLFLLGFGDHILGVDQSSLFPPEATKLKQIGYQRALSAEGIVGLGPTLVLAGAEAGPPGALGSIRAANIRVEKLGDVISEADAAGRILSIGRIVGKEAEASVLADKITTDLKAVERRLAGKKRTPKALIVYARGPGTLHVFGKGTGADAMLRMAGAENVAGALQGVKPLTAESLAMLAPEFIFIPTKGLESVGGLEVLMKTPGLAETPAGKQKRIVPVDDLLLLGFGPRLPAGVTALVNTLHPDLPAQAQ